MIKPLTSFRFIFAFMVFWSHIQFFVADDYPAFDRIQRFVTSEGFVGVSFFFILSGFILSLSYEERLLSRKVSVAEFWVGRIARIYPLHLLTLLLGLLLVLESPTETGDFFGDPASSTVRFISNALLIQAFIPQIDYFFSYNAPSWSLSAEMFFYLAFPFIVLLFIRNRMLLRYGVVLFVAVPLVLYNSPSDGHHRFMYINPIFRLVDFLFGITLYQLFKRGWFGGLFRSKASATLVEALSITAFAIVFHYHLAVPIGYRYSCYYWVPIALIILSFAHQAGYLSALLSTKTMVWLGEISFAFYLIHQLVIRLLVDQNSLHHLVDNSYVLTGIMFGLSLGLAHLLHRFVEVPGNRYVKARYQRSRFAHAPDRAAHPVPTVPVAEAVPTP